MATNARQEEWMRGAVGRAMDPDGAWQLQCVDVADDYAEFIHGVSWQTCFGGGNAREHWPKNNGYWTSIKPTGNNRPLRGDVVIWDGNQFGHIAVVASSTMSTISVYQQNYNTPTPTKPCSLDTVPWNLGGLYVKGWLRPNVPGADIPDPGEVELGGGTAGSTATPAPIRNDNQRWARESVIVRSEPRANASKSGEIKKDDLVTMDGYVLGEWFEWGGEGSSFWYKVAAVGKSGGRSGMDWDLVAQRESGGDWACNTGNGFCGGLQFLPSTWDEFGGRKYAPCAHLATREQQIEIAERVLAVQGPNAWPNTHQGAYHPNGSGDSEMKAVSGFVPFAYFNPLETFGVPDVTAYSSWTTNIPSPPDLPADAPEAHWDGNAWYGWQWNSSKTQVVWVTPNGTVHNGAYAPSSNASSASAMYPEPLPTQGPVERGSVSTAMWNYLMFIGWGGIPYDGERLWPPGTPGIRYEWPQPDGPVRQGEITTDHWNALLTYGWYVTNPDGATPILNPPQRPMVVAAAYGSASAVSYAGRAYGPTFSTIPADSKRGMRGKWRYIAQRATTGEFLDFDLPLSRDELTWELSGPGALRATISPDKGMLRAPDGRLLLEEWGTCIYAEAGGEIRWGGILVNSGWNGADWSIECAGFSAYPNGQPYSSEYSQTGVDPGEVIRHIWDHLQSYRGGNLNVRVTDSLTGALIGLPTGPVTQADVPPHVYDYLRRANWSFRDGDTADRIYPPGYTGDVPPKNNQNPLDPFEMLWWEAPDCGQTINNIARDTPLDYVERHSWDPSAREDTILHEIQIAFPRTGRRRQDLAFIQGDNVMGVVAPSTDGDFYANNILGIGSGEGEGSIRRSTGLDDGRLRRVAVYSGKDTNSAAQLDNVLSQELRRRTAILVIDQIDVLDHPNAPIGSWALGDDILVRADIPWLGEIELWCRITGWSLTSDSTATLRLARSDSFSYAAVTTDPGDGPITGNTDDVPYPANDLYPDETLYPNDPEHTQGE